MNMHSKLFPGEEIEPICTTSKNGWTHNSMLSKRSPIAYSESGSVSAPNPLSKATGLRYRWIDALHLLWTGNPVPVIPTFEIVGDDPVSNQPAPDIRGIAGGRTKRAEIHPTVTIRHAFIGEEELAMGLIPRNIPIP